LKLDPNKALLVVCITLFVVIGINAAIYVSVTRKNTVGQIELLRRTARQTRNPWGKEDKDLQELAEQALKIKELRVKNEGEKDEGK
jgi:hypothetical protein